ncbi:unnamed protein product [Darwinula stevensoni]|uniref:Uncharacterized protein n=1 Tax=Darwinula stevensoni TaxID=69355 RepID=A0A7R9ABW6_9CRUS|nr:unnamed protein product [Darwinula stevensoni]CAG0899836.1 unnamed protein product [Darwinula stevensoni]
MQCLENFERIVQYAGAKVTGWLREETGEMPGIFFYESIADLAGIMTVFEFHVADDDVLHVRGTTFDPLDPGVVLAEEILQCRLGGAARFYAAAYDRVELMHYESVVEAQTSGGKLAVQIDFGGCVDWTGGVNLTGVMTGAYLHDLFDFVPEGEPSSIFTSLLSPTMEEIALVSGMTAALLGSAHALKSDPASGVAYESFDVFVFESGNPMVIPGYWRIDESGDWGNDFGAAFMDCPIGRGVRIFQEV